MGIADYIELMVEGESVRDLVAMMFIDEYIKKEGDKYTVYSHQTNKKFGSYSTLAAAKKRLQQMHAFSKSK